MSRPGSYNFEGFQLTELSSVPRYPLVESLKNLFEPDDRRQAWFQANLLNDQVYFVGHRYNVRSSSSSDKKIEHPTTVRLEDQWFGLNRTGEAEAILGALSYTQWRSEDRFFPIPLPETLLNRSLKQIYNY